jgi:hypothetical protein
MSFKPNEKECLIGLCFYTQIDPVSTLSVEKHSGRLESLIHPNNLLYV